MSGWIAGLLWRVRYPACAVILLGFVVLAPSTNFTELDNDISAWISKTDPVYQTYERFRAEFGGGRPLIVALKSDRLFTRESLEFIRDVTEDIRRVDTVERVQSLSTANIVEALPPRPDDEGGIEVRPLLDDLDKPGAPDVARRRALDDPLLRGDLVSDDGTVTAIVVTFDEDRIDQVRAGVIEMIHKLVDPRLPPGMEAFWAPTVVETFPRFTMLATDFETVRGPWGMRGEIAWFPDDTLQSFSPVTPVPGRSIEAGIGVDRRAGNYRVSGNVLVARRRVDRAVLDANPIPFDARIENTDVSLVGWAERTFARETRTVRMLAVYNPDAASAFVRGVVAFSLRDNLLLETSAGWLRGTELDLLSRLSTRDFVYARLKVYF